ncbi:hypothetical protein ZIOFF_014733 [Zingiber officinale]|uniref:Helicase ATP-binding domain-containing protein n=1 Tax=Zingiber officinale TaxID=94328 RepID=A0A8J5HWV1_ZINOF|nr:hypothetical protein ZIOFF_014733 [Zingiber officinale]
MAAAENHPSHASDRRAEHAKTLVGALNLITRNLPLPLDVFRAVASIYQGDTPPDVEETTEGGDASSPAELDTTHEVSTSGSLISEFEDALLKQKMKHMHCLELEESKENHFNSLIQHRLKELEVLPSNKGEDLQMKCLLELYGLKLVELQRKVRSDVSAEYWLRRICAQPDKILFDWGMMRFQYPFSMYGIGDAAAVEADSRRRKKRYAERLSRLEEDEKNQADDRKRKFFAEILNAAREFQLQTQAVLKRRKQRNDGVQAWHARQRQRATRAEKSRFQALKADDQEAYMRLVEESKNERLTMLLGKTNELLVRLGAAVQRQKDAEHADGLEDSSTRNLPEISLSKTEGPGQRQYNSAVHSIEEKVLSYEDSVGMSIEMAGPVIKHFNLQVTEQPSNLQGGELRPYQLEGLQWMLSLFNNNLNGILADEMGLGKTIQTIALIAYLMENKSVTGPHLIVAPKAVLPNWISEFSTWAPSIVAVLYDGRLIERKAMREEYSGQGKFNVMITHYDLIMRDKAFLKKIHWHYMIVDEGHRLKNHESVLAKTIVSG